jgi:hypothetical protein
MDDLSPKYFLARITDNHGFSQARLIVHCENAPQAMVALASIYTQTNDAKPWDHTQPNRVSLYGNRWYQLTKIVGIAPETVEPMLDVCDVHYVSIHDVRRVNAWKRGHCLEVA